MKDSILGYKRNPHKHTKHERGMFSVTDEIHTNTQSNTHFSNETYIQYEIRL